MKKIEVKIKENNEKDNAGYSVFTLLLLLSGVFGLMSLLNDVEGILYSKWAVYSFTTFFCVFLWFLRSKSKMIFWIIALLTVFICAVFTLLTYNPFLKEQLSYFRNGILGTGNGGVEGSSFTVPALLFFVLISLLLFILEIIIKSHGILYMATTALLLLLPLAGIHVSLSTVLLLALFQIAVAAVQSLNLHYGVKGFRIGDKNKMIRLIAGAVSVFVIAAFLIVCPFISGYSDRLFDYAYEAEGFFYRYFINMSGMADELISNGLVGSGNNYNLGTPHLEITVSDQPTETLYLRGFKGGEYVGGQWLKADEASLFVYIADALNWKGRGQSVFAMYESMYFTMNDRILENKILWPYTVTVRHINGKYNEFYVPYYGLRRQGLELGGYSGPDFEGYTGYVYQFFERKDMNIDWYKDGSAHDTLVGWYKMVHDTYLEEAGNVYTNVPKELLPRLTKLVEENPLTDLKDITAFILYTLHNNAVYTMTPGWAPINEEIAEYFLFERHRGYCVHFATAATLMYRLYGIPARYAAGYAVSPSDFSLKDDGNFVAVATDGDSHAWVEIFLPDCGWTPVEVTPAKDGTGFSGTIYPGFSSLELDRKLKEKDWNIGLPGTETSDVTNNNKIKSELFAENDEGGHWNFTDLKNFFDEYRGLFIAAGACIGCLFIMLPLFLDYRRTINIKRVESMGCRKIFTRLMKMLHYCNEFTGSNGNETDFALRLSALVPDISIKEAEEFMECVNASAYGPDSKENIVNPVNSFSENADIASLPVSIYRKTASLLYGRLGRCKKLIFRYVKNYD